MVALENNVVNDGYLTYAPVYSKGKSGRTRKIKWSLRSNRSMVAAGQSLKSIFKVGPRMQSKIVLIPQSSQNC